MKKILALLIVTGSTLSLSACGGLPTCNESLDNCDRGGAYTEERTVEAGNRRRAVPVATPEPSPAPVITAPEPILVEPKPMPAPVVDTQIMRSAEPQFKQISK